MRFMLIVRSVPDFEAELRPDPDPEVMAEMAAFHDELARAGVLLDGSGLRPSRDGALAQNRPRPPRTARRTPRGL